MWEEWKQSEEAGAEGNLVPDCLYCQPPTPRPFIPHPQASPDSAHILLKAGRDTRGTPASNDISVDVKDLVRCGGSVMITRLVECDGRPDNPASDKHARRVVSHEP